MTVSYQDDLYQSIESLDKSFPSLNILQLKTLVDSYTPDKYIKHGVSPKIQESITKLAKKASSKDKNKGELLFPVILSLAKIKPIDPISDDSSLELSE